MFVLSRFRNELEREGGKENKGRPCLANEDGDVKKLRKLCAVLDDLVQRD